MRRTPRLCVAVIDHSPDAYLDDLIAGLRTFFPGADIVWYDSGQATRTPPDVQRLPCSRIYSYAKIAGIFFDLFEWWIDEGHDYLINVETDLAVINPGVEVVTDLMRDSDYMAAHLVAQVPTTSRWRPYLSLRPELPELCDILGTKTVQGAFSPAQVFSRRYIERIIDSSFYPRLRGFLERNQSPGGSFTLQEVLLPTLAQVRGLRLKSYPTEHEAFNRYRPYHALRSVRAAQAASVPFIHPIRRNAENDARRYIRDLVALDVPGA